MMSQSDFAWFEFIETRSEVKKMFELRNPEENIVPFGEGEVLLVSNAKMLWIIGICSVALLGRCAKFVVL